MFVILVSIYLFFFIIEFGFAFLILSLFFFFFVIVTRRLRQQVDAAELRPSIMHLFFSVVE